MGLDMFLYAKRYMGWEFHADTKTKASEVQKIFPELEPFGKDGNPVSYVVANVGCWRKANAIHRWFVENVQNGNDDCQTYFVPREHLVTLRQICRDVLADNSKAEELLPTQSGFFFGGTAYGEDYLYTVENTADIIDICLELPNEWDFEYQASW